MKKLNASNLESMSATALYSGEPCGGGFKNYGDVMQDIGDDGERFKIITSHDPKTFGQHKLKIQQKGQKHESTRYEDI